MEKCYLCGKEFEPIKLPIELPEIWGIKLPHACPVCSSIGIDIFTIVVNLFRDLFYVFYGR